MWSVSRTVLFVIVCSIVLGGAFHTATADTEANKEAYRRLNQEAWSQGDLAVVDEIIAPGYVYHEPTLGDMAGPEGLKQAIMVYRMAYPDLQFTIDETIAEGDLVAMRWTAAGTQSGELLGIPTTGLHTTSVGINIAQFKDGRIIEEWSSWDVMGLMQQLGVVSPPRPGPEDYLWDAPSDIAGDPGDPVLNKLLVLRVKAQFWNGKDIAGLDETHHANAIGHDPSFPGPPSYEAYKQSCLMYQVAFPDFHVTMHAVFAEGDKVVTRWTATGTQEGELLGIPASGRQVMFDGITIYRLADGKVAETWWAYDALGVVQQITSGSAYSPVGTWLVSAPTDAGRILMLHTIYAQDLTGTNFGGVLKQINTNPTYFGMIPEGESGGDYWTSQTLRTGLNEYESTFIDYLTKQGPGPVSEIVAMVITQANWTITGPDTNEGTATQAVYLAAQDADGDGLPDEGQEPVSCAPFTYTSKRLKPMPGCTPGQ